MSPGTEGALIGILLVLLVFREIIVHFRISDLRRDLEYTRVQLEEARGTLYRLGDVTAEALRLLGLEWTASKQGGWRKP